MKNESVLSIPAPAEIRWIHRSIQITPAFPPRPCHHLGNPFGSARRLDGIKRQHFPFNSHHFHHNKTCVADLPIYTDRNNELQIFIHLYGSPAVSFLCRLCDGWVFVIVSADERIPIPVCGTAETGLMWGPPSLHSPVCRRPSLM